MQQVIKYVIILRSSDFGIEEVCALCKEASNPLWHFSASYLPLVSGMCIIWMLDDNLRSVRLSASRHLQQNVL